MKIEFEWLYFVQSQDYCRVNTSEPCTVQQLIDHVVELSKTEYDFTYGKFTLMNPPPYPGRKYDMETLCEYEKGRCGESDRWWLKRKDPEIMEKVANRKIGKLYATTGYSNTDFSIWVEPEEGEAPLLWCGDCKAFKYFDADGKKVGCLRGEKVWYASPVCEGFDPKGGRADGC